MVPETPAERLEEALSRMSFRVEAGSFALAGFAEPPVAADLPLAAPAQIVLERGETTVLLREEDLAGLVARHPGARVERDLFWVRFDAPMGWEVVGFLARVTAALAEGGVPLGCVCGYSRDHLFIARRHEEAARRVLAGMFPERGSG